MTKDQPLDEFALIARIFAPLAAGDPNAFGLLDDAAIIAPRPGEDLVVKTDGLVAGVHFFAGDPPDAIAQKLLRVNLSDLAAKGARPHGYVLTAAFPQDVSLAWLEGFAAGLKADQAEFGLHLLGGDTMATPGPLTLSLTALGHVPQGTMIRRAGAKPGDAIYVTGTVGDAGLGLASLKKEALGLSEADTVFVRERYLRPRPRLSFGQALRGLAHAALDVSDGVIADLQHLADVSAVRARLELAALPLSPAAARWAGGGSDRLLRLAAAGDDYEILFAAPPEAASRLVAKAARSATAIARIGTVEAGAGVEVRGPDGRALPAGRGGYRHF
jgi:thiamine-monophosphate kinase